MSNQLISWSNQYKLSKQNPAYPTEWVIRTIAGANYPKYKFDKNRYKGKKILDMSCGDGRNLQLLINLGFKVFASEISDEIIDTLKEKYPAVKFNVGLNHKQPFDDNCFDYALASSSFYYLDNKVKFSDNLVELNRILKKEAVFFANMSTNNTYVLKNATNLGNGEYLITSDPHNFRNGNRWQVVNSVKDLKYLFHPYLKVLATSKLNDDYFGYRISNYILIAENLK